MGAGPPKVTRSEAARLVLGVVSAGIGIDGALMLLVGGGALVPSTGVGADAPVALTIGGATVALLAFGTIGRRLGGALGALAPRLYPFAPLPVNAAIYVALLVGAVSVFHGFFDVFTSAHNGGVVSSLSDQGDLSALLIGASVVVWILTLYAILVMFRVFQLGRIVDARSGGRDVYGRTIEEGSEVVGPRPRGGPSPPPDPLARAVLFSVTLLLALVISAGIQILEVDVGPAPVLAWVYAQPFTPLLTLPVASGISLVDRGLRDLERRYAERLAQRDTPEPSGNSARKPGPVS